MKSEVLLVEDSLDFQDLVCLILRDKCHVTVVPSIRATLEIVNSKKFDLILMDVMLDDGNGFDLAEQLVASAVIKDTPIIFLTTKNDIKDKTVAFTIGAEDYIVKPFDPNEFLLRVEARLRKKKPIPISSEITKGNLRLEAVLQRASLINENRNLHLTPLEFKILYALASSEPHILSRDSITKMIWGEDIHVGRSLDTHVTSLRKKLELSGASISSVYGQGYRFSATT